MTPLARMKSRGSSATTFGSARRGVNASEGNAIGLRQRLGHLLFGTGLLIDENFAEQFLVLGLSLFVERKIELRAVDEATAQEKLTERRRKLCSFRCDLRRAIRN